MNILNERKNGVLLHISSLPGNAGIGTLGKNAYDFVDFLKKSLQTYWQILPIGPTGYGDSPYQSFSTFAGNPYFIDFDLLEKEGLLQKSDYNSVKWSEKEDRVDYGLLYVNRHKIFSIIQKNFEKNIPDDYEKFCKENSFWLNDYSLFMAIKDENNGKSFTDWESEIKLRKTEAISFYTKKCESRINYYKILQYLFYKQWNNLKKYANENGIKIIGDIPIYVAADSADVWANPAQFMLDENMNPIEVAGCPPDGFSADGQLWGNPVYNWEYMKNDNYSWWKKRLEMSLKNYDVVRIDHFRGFESFYCIPYGDKTARNGCWKKGPGVVLFNEIKKSFGDVSIIAEDLGFLTDDVRKMLSDVGYPGMKVLQFAFDSRESSEYLPFSYPKNSVVYTGTHDNETIKGWMKNAPKQDFEYAKKYIRSIEDIFPKEMMLTAMESASNTCILCMQDLIGLGPDARMNKPSTMGNNWVWRAKSNEITQQISDFLREYTGIYKRN